MYRCIMVVIRPYYGLTMAAFRSAQDIDDFSLPAGRRLRPLIYCCLMLSPCYGLWQHFGAQDSAILPANLPDPAHSLHCLMPWTQSYIGRLTKQ